jgi:hypothetical protein
MLDHELEEEAVELGAGRGLELLGMVGDHALHEAHVRG